MIKFQTGRMTDGGGESSFIRDNVVWINPLHIVSFTELECYGKIYSNVETITGWHYTEMTEKEFLLAMRSEGRRTGSPNV